MPLFLNLVAMHFLLDYPLQGDFIARGKNHRANPTPLFGVPWWHCLTAHAFIQGGGVALLTGSWTLGLAEFGIHWLADYVKSDGLTGINGDQVIHLACKVIWAWLIVMGNYPLWRQV